MESCSLLCIPPKKGQENFVIYSSCEKTRNFYKTKWKRVLGLASYFTSLHCLTLLFSRYINIMISNPSHTGAAKQNGIWALRTCMLNLSEIAHLSLFLLLLYLTLFGLYCLQFSFWITRLCSQLFYCTFQIRTCWTFCL